MSKELSDYTSEELRAELTRRRAEKTRLALKERKERGWYIYQECTVKEIRINQHTFGDNRIVFVMDKDYGFHCRDLHNSIYDHGYRMATGMGFVKDTRPKVGDRVLMRRRDYADKRRNYLGEYKIIKVLGENENEIG